MPLFTLKEISETYSNRLSSGGFKMDPAQIETILAQCVDFARGLILSNAFKNFNHTYVLGRYMEDTPDICALYVALESTGSITDAMGAILDLAQADIDNTGSAKIVTMDDLAHRTFELYDKGFDPGLETSWRGFNTLFRAAKRQLTVVTGMGGAGKSTWLDNYLIGLARAHKWKFCFYSPENYPVEFHIEKLASVIVGRPFNRGPSDRMSAEELSEAMAFIKDHFIFVSSDDNATLDVITNVFRKAIDEHGVDSCIIDPWNTVEHKRPKDQSETDYICESLTRLLGFSRRKNIHLWVVAHPSKMKRGKDDKFPPPTPYDISGCYSEDTEVATDRGWLRHDQINLSEDKVLCFDKEIGVIKYLKASNLFSGSYSGKMHHYHGYSLDLLVTPNHRMLLQAAWDGSPGKWIHKGWQFERSENLKRAKYRMPLSAMLVEDYNVAFCIPGTKDNLAAWRFAAWYITEGWVSMNSPSVCQANENKSLIYSDLVSLGIPFSDTITHYKEYEKPMWSARIRRRGSESFCDWIIDNCGEGCENKKMPEQIWVLPYSYKRAFFDALISGDGWKRRFDPSRKRQGGYQFCTTSKTLSDQMQRLCFELGMYSSLTVRQGSKSHHKKIYSLSIGSESRRERVIVIPRNRSEIDYCGEVYCLTVPTGAYVTRRNGKISICGNSAHWANRPDNNITVHRTGKGAARVIVSKVRFRMYGRTGEQDFTFDHATNRFAEATPVDI